MKIKGVLFDMDGLLLDTERLFQEIWKEAARERGIELDPGFTKEITGTTGVGTRMVVEKYYHVEDGTDIVKECWARANQRFDESVPLKKGVVEILQYFKSRGFKIAVASSSSLERIEKNMNQVGIMEYFDALASGTQVAHGKPEPDIFLYAAEKIGCKPEECYVFEDSVNGLKAGRAAGCVTVMIPDLMEPTPEVEPYCDGIYDSLLDAMEAMPFGGK